MKESPTRLLFEKFDEFWKEMEDLTIATFGVEMAENIRVASRVAYLQGAKNAVKHLFPEAKEKL